MSASISPGGAEIKLHMPGGNKIFNPVDYDSDNFDLQLEWVNYLDDLLRNAEIVFNDSSSVKLQASSSVPRENDVVTLFSAWESTVNIYEAESVRIGGVTLKLG